MQKNNPSFLGFCWYVAIGVPLRSSGYDAFCFFGAAPPNLKTKRWDEIIATPMSQFIICMNAAICLLYPHSILERKRCIVDGSTSPFVSHILRFVLQVFLCGSCQASLLLPNIFTVALYFACISCVHEKTSYIVRAERVSPKPQNTQFFHSVPALHFALNRNLPQKVIHKPSLPLTRFFRLIISPSALPILSLSSVNFFSWDLSTQYCLFRNTQFTAIAKLRFPRHPARDRDGIYDRLILGSQGFHMQLAKPPQQPPTASMMNLFQHRVEIEGAQH